MWRVNGWLTVFGVAMIDLLCVPVAEQRRLRLGLSLWALVSGHWAWQAARVDVAQQAEIDREQARPVEDRVVEKVVRETELDRA
jgi:hypothetical protein